MASPGKKLARPYLKSKVKAKVWGCGSSDREHAYQAPPGPEFTPHTIKKPPLHYIYVYMYIYNGEGFFFIYINYVLLTLFPLTFQL
jgi:hypothetical protein